jgi:hypothetical protein
MVSLVVVYASEMTCCTSSLTPKGLGLPYVGFSECILFLEFMKLFVMVDMDRSFPMRCYM